MWDQMISPIAAQDATVRATLCQACTRLRRAATLDAEPCPAELVILGLCAEPCLLAVNLPDLAGLRGLAVLTLSMCTACLVSWGLLQVVQAIRLCKLLCAALKALAAAAGGWQHAGCS